MTRLSLVATLAFLVAALPAPAQPPAPPLSDTLTAHGRTTMAEPFEGWGIVEVLGHKQFAGKISEHVIGGGALLRVDVPESVSQASGHQGFTRPAYSKLIGLGSIYMVTPTTEDVARKAAAQLALYNDPLPVELPKLVPRHATARVVDNDQYDHWRDG